MQTLYPFKFTPLFKEKIWGGDKIKTQLGMDFGTLPNCGEAWLLSGVEGNPSLVSNGYLAGNELNELVEVFMGDLTGEKVYERFGDQFPILVKAIDSNDWLSLQVHPDDELAQKRGIGFGKTEMWYVMQADEGAQLISGFNQKVSPEQYLRHLENKNIKEVMNFEQVKKGDVFFIPAGRVHALGPGTLIAEIQQTSDITYRIYDWDRTDENGKGRELHIEEAMEAIDYSVLPNYKTPYHLVESHSENLVRTPFFTTNILNINQKTEKDYSDLDSFVILFCTEGECTVVSHDLQLSLKPGEIILIPNLIENISLIPSKNTTLLEVYIE